MKLKKLILSIEILAIIFTIGFIWYNSFLPVPSSQSVSRTATEVVENITSPTTNEKDFNILVNKVRKAAHMVEFFALGVECSAFILTVNKRSIQWIFNVMSFLLFTAVMDESIQIVSGRGPLITDVLRDIIGGVAGTIVTLFFGSAVLYLIKISKNKRKSLKAK